MVPSNREPILLTQRENTMNQLTKPTTSGEVTVNVITGEAYISQRKLAEKLSVPKSTVYNWLTSYVKNFNGAVKPDTKQGLSSEIVAEAVQYFALDYSTPTQEAKDLLRQINKAGAKAWLYHEAGYVVSASPVKPMALPEDYVSALRALADATEQKILLIAENREKHIETDSSNDYFTVRKVKSLNQGMKLDGKLLAKRSEKLEVIVKQIFDLYEQNVNSYHKDIWLDVYPDVILPD